jgi:hypothetical protein
VNVDVERILRSGHRAPDLAVPCRALWLAGVGVTLAFVPFLAGAPRTAREIEPAAR